jgi:hypothetical protein
VSEVTYQRTVVTNDGTEIVVDAWLAEEDQVVMSPGESAFSATCPEHGEIATGYVAPLVAMDVAGHADDYHDGIARPAELLDVGPYIQM